MQATAELCVHSLGALLERFSFLWRWVAQGLVLAKHMLHHWTVLATAGGEKQPWWKKKSGHVHCSSELSAWQTPLIDCRVSLPLS